MPCPSLNLLIGGPVRLDGSWDELPDELRRKVFQSIPTSVPQLRTPLTNASLYRVEIGDLNLEHALQFDGHHAEVSLKTGYMEELDRLEQTQKEIDWSNVPSEALIKDILEDIVKIGYLTIEFYSLSLYRRFEAVGYIEIKFLGYLNGVRKWRVLLPLVSLGRRQPVRTRMALEVLFEDVIMRDLWRALVDGLRSEATLRKVQLRDNSTIWIQMPLYKQLVIPTLLAIGKNHGMHV
jgi:hypothetical protein